jgi:SagB-type dehydrogenase family enzyme
MRPEDPVGSAVAERWVVSASTTVVWRDGQLEITTAGSQVKLATDHVDVLRVLHAFAEPRTIEDAIAALEAWPSEQVVTCISELVEAGALELTAGGARPAGDEWDPYSLAFHRSTRAATLQPLAATDEPAVAPRRPSRPEIALGRSACEEPRALAHLLDARQSSRRWPATPIAFDVFSRFLWLSARNRAIVDAGRPDTRVSRPYPSGGGAYSLELYPILAPDAVESLAPGVYRYLPESHGLEHASDDEASYVPCLEAAARSAGSARPPVVIAVTSRYARQAATYGTLAYSLVLKEVGCLFQTAYLAAGALGLGVCALGGGTPDNLLARACDLEADAEPVVGELMIGPAAPSRAPRTPR